MRKSTNQFDYHVKMTFLGFDQILPLSSSRFVAMYTVFRLRKMRREL